MKELGWQQESLTNSSSRPPIQIRSTRSDHMIKELFMKKKRFPANFYFFNDKEALDPGLRREIKEIVGSKWTFPISMADCIPRTFLIGRGEVL